MHKLIYDIPVYHDTLYEAVYLSSVDLQKIVMETAKRYPDFPKFAQEVYSRLYGKNKKRIPADDVAYWHKWAESLHNCIDQAQEMDSLASSINRDAVKAAMSTVEILKTIVEKLPDEKIPDIDEIEKAIEGMDGLDGLDQKKEQLIKKLEKARNKAAGVSFDKDAMRLAIRKSAEKVNENMEAMSVLVESPGSEADSLSHDNTKRYIRALKRVQYDKQLLKFIQLCGNLENSYTREKRNMETYSRTESSDIVLGDDIARALMVEHMDDDLFDLKFMSEELMMRDVKSKEPKDKGDVVVCVDFSGSMKELERSDIAKAIVIALYRQLRKEKRGFHACLFNAKVVYEFSRDRGDVIEFLEFEPKGGTVVEPALEWAKMKITKESDVVIISDGCFEVADPAKWKAAFNKCHVMSILLGGCDIRPLQSISDKVLETGDLLSSAGDLFRFICK